MYTNRISTAARYNLLTSDIQKNEALFNKLTAQLASGKKITSITDDPIGAVNVVNTNRQLGQIETFNKNVEMGMTELDTLDDLMELAGGYLSKAWDKAVQANNQNYGVTSLKALKVEIDEITKTMVDLANTEFNDSFVFGGTNTKLTPYTIDETTGDIIYNGTPSDNPEYIRSTEVADGVFEILNVTGDRVFGYYRGADNSANMYTDGNGKRVTKGDDNIYRYENGNIYRSGRSNDGLTEVTDGDGNKVVGAYTDSDNKIVYKVAVETDDGSGNITTTYKYQYENGDLYGDGTSAEGLTQIKDSDGNAVNAVYTDANGKKVFASDVTETDENGVTTTYTRYQYQNGDLYGTGKDDSGLTQGAPEESYGVMGALKKLSISIQEVIDAKEAGDTDAEQLGYEHMNATLDMFKDSLEIINTEQTKFGGVHNRLEMTESTLGTNAQNLTSYLSQIQEVDLAKAISDWYQAQYAYQASLQVAAASMNMSLLNYI